MEPSLSLYHIFYITARCGNISRASRELFISQPAVSRSIRRLEENLQTVLFRRNSRGVTLTEDGRLLFDRVREAFEALESAEQTLARRHSLGVSHLRLGASSTLCKYALLPFLQKFIRRYPHVKVTISCQSTYQTLELLREQKLDIGLVGRPTSLKVCDFFPVQTIQDTFVATEAYLSNLSLREQDADLLRSGTFMLLDEENITRQYVDRYLSEHQLVLPNLLEVSSMDLLIEFARIGMGIACVIREFVRKELDDGLLTEVPLGFRFHPREIGFACRRGLREYSPIREFLELSLSSSRN